MPARPTLVASLGAFALATSMLSGCGSSASDAYCKELKADKAYFDSFSGSNPDVSKLDEAFERMHTLADKAPDEVASDWKTIDGAIDTIDKALKDAGLTFKDIQDMQKTGKAPEGADMTKLTELGTKLQSLGDKKFENAADAIEKHAKDECGITLGSS